MQRWMEVYRVDWGAKDGQKQVKKFSSKRYTSRRSRVPNTGFACRRAVELVISLPSLGITSNCASQTLELVFGARWVKPH
jgi:hypothetical protein